MVATKKQQRKNWPLIEAELVDAGERIQITVPFDAEGKLSGSGNNTTHVSTRGNQPVVVDGFGLLRIGCNGFC